MKISFLTLEPEAFGSFLSSHAVRRATQLGRLETEVVDIRETVEGSFRAVDDSPFGGGRGLILRAEPIRRALEQADPGHRALRVALTPAGVPHSQAMARSLAGEEHLVFVCGHYEGIDERAYDLVDLRLSIGDYVLTGGELAACVAADSVVRLLPGVLRTGSAEEESFEEGLLEYPQYTQPAVWEGREVPSVLLSGDHARIARWRREMALEQTRRFRPDLLEKREDGKTDQNR